MCQRLFIYRRTFERFVHVCTSRGHLEQGSRAARRSGKRSNLVTGHGLETSVAWASVAGPCDAAIADGGPTQSQRTQERRNGRFVSRGWQPCLLAWRVAMIARRCIVWLSSRHPLVHSSAILSCHSHSLLAVPSTLAFA